jgi:hypothetical protein
MYGHFTYLPAVLLASILLCSCSGGAGFGSGHFRRTPLTDYFFVGGEPSAFSGTNGADAELQGLTTALLGDRAYYFGLYRQGDRFDTEVSELHEDRADSTLLLPASEGDPSRYLAEGTVNPTDGTVRVDLSIPTVDTALERFDNLYLVGTFDQNIAQDLIHEVRTPAFEDNQSSTTVTADFTLTGSRDGETFSISFEQVLRAYADTYFVTL